MIHFAVRQGIEKRVHSVGVLFGQIGSGPRKKEYHFLTLIVCRRKHQRVRLVLVFRLGVRSRLKKRSDDLGSGIVHRGRLQWSNPVGVRLGGIRVGLEQCLNDGDRVFVGGCRNQRRFSCSAFGLGAGLQ